MNRKMTKTASAAAAILLALPAVAQAQSRSFKLGQWVEIENSIIRELNNSYVDTLPVDRIYRAAIDEMLAGLDPYTIYVPEEEQEDFTMMISNTYGGIGAVIRKMVGEPVYINEPYAGSPAARSGLQCGDRILEIDGVSTLPLSSKESSDRMKGKPGSTVRFKVEKVRTGEIVEIPIVREKIHLPDIEYAGMLDAETGYIYQSGFTEGVAETMKAKFLELKNKGMKRFVLDLRGNGGGLMAEAVNIISLFVPKGSLAVSSRGRAPGMNREMHTVTEPVDTEMPMIVMIDGGSASSSEIVTGALQDLDRATVMGVRSYGKGLIQSVRPLSYNGQLKVTTGKYYTPSGRCVQAIDYARRNDDGSVQHIPDSLTSEFKTAHGRTVRDGGGITPDVTIDLRKYSRLVYSLVLGGVIDSYVLEYVKNHDSIPAVDDFHYEDADFEEFIAFAKTQEFDYRSSAKTLFDQMKKELEEDGLKEGLSEELAALEKGLEMDKERFIRLKKDEIVPFIEEEIATRYWYQEAGIKIRLRYDEQLKKALASPLIKVD
ncbi:MAG: S41 family peptidase [Bacteroidales bacterium]|nr:S41 family peptidase [Bacteroidales bacterium]